MRWVSFGNGFYIWGWFLGDSRCAFDAPVPFSGEFRMLVFGYALRFRAGVLRAYYVVGRSRSGDCLAGFVCNHVGWLHACVVICAWVACVVSFFWSCHEDWVDA